MYLLMKMFIFSSDLILVQLRHLQLLEQQVSLFMMYHLCDLSYLKFILKMENCIYMYH